MDIDRSQTDHPDMAPEEGQLRLVPPTGWRPPPEAGRVILRIVLAAHERRAAA